MSNHLRRQIQTDLYRDFTFLGVNGKDLPWALGIGLLTPPILIIIGYPLQGLIIPFLWFIIVIPFLQWSRVNRRPYWFTHWIKCKLFGRTFSKIIHGYWKESEIIKE